LYRLSYPGSDLLDLNDDSDFPRFFATTMPFYSSRKNLVPDVGFEILTDEIIKRVIFWNITPASVFFSFLINLPFGPDLGDDTFLRNVSELLPKCAVSCPVI
jgi:hypothetical protein